jgi:hypothetical protein
MSNKYFDSANNPNRAVPYEVARAEQINNTDDLIEQGMELVEKDIIRSIKLPEGTTADQVITATPSQRQNALLGFDASGNIVVTGSDVVARQGKVMGWDVNGNIILYDYANDITDPVNAAAASAAAAAESAIAAALFDPSSYYVKSIVDEKISVKQDALVSGENIKTVNGESVIGIGNIEATPLDYKTVKYLSYVSI